MCLCSFRLYPPGSPRDFSTKNVAVVGGCSQQDQPTGDALRGIQADSNSVGVPFVQQQTSSNPSSPLINQPIITTHHPTHHQHIIKNLSFFGFLVFLKGKHFFPIQKTTQKLPFETQVWAPHARPHPGGLGRGGKMATRINGVSLWLDATYHLFFGNQETPLKENMFWVNIHLFLVKCVLFFLIWQICNV